jgi:protein-S-isoprenylcysteine O-methyltransferase Ste14
MPMRWFALVMLGTFFAVVGAGRMALHRWRYGTWGWALSPQRPLDLAQSALSLGALAIAVQALLVAWRPEAVTRMALPWLWEHPAPLLAGLVAAGGLVLVLVAQLQMGRSWRIGIDDQARTALVTEGLYARVRNPIYLGLLVGLTAFGLTVPTWLSLGTVALAWVSILAIVRQEEAYLLRVHGAAFEAYAAHVPRFVPRLLAR